uniref:Arginine/serine-rich splicing factor SCL33 transcript III n=2 Tax=Physcomitrium patens TaxID=3218 RepID=M1H9F3_PHYPA|nr:arginine/serine-rich splicing factor SCL33 transcript III [Physcomitrium patens]
MRGRSPYYSPRRGYDSPPRRGYDSPPRRSYGGRRRSPSPPPRGGRGGYGREPEPPTSLLVRNIPRDCTADDLRIPFERYGVVKDVYLPRDYYTGL